MKLENKTAIVTGASKGIGAAIAKGLAAEGAKVVVNYMHSETGANQVVAEIAANGGTALALQADVSNEADIMRLFDETAKAFGSLDILVNNAGIYNYEPIEEISVATVHEQFNINVLGPLLTIREAVKLFGSKGGNIINISSAASNLAMATGSVYSATKAALDTITVALSKEFSGRNIRINLVLPGSVETEGTHRTGVMGSDFEKTLIANTPLGRIGQPDDIAKVVTFLASADAAWVTGEKIAVSGGIYGF